MRINIHFPNKWNVIPALVKAYGIVHIDNKGMCNQK